MGKGRAPGAHLLAQPRGARDIHLKFPGRGGLDQHHAIFISRCGQRHLAFGHIARHTLRLPLERIAPAASAGRHHPHHLACEHRLAIDQPAEIAWRALHIDRDAEWLAGLSPVDAVASEPHPVGGDDGAAIDQRAVMFFVAEPAAPLAGAAGIRVAARASRPAAESASR